MGTVINQDYVTGPTTIKGLNYRVDTISGSDGFRDLGSKDFEIRPDFLWNVNDHPFEFTIDARQIHQTPDSYGLIYSSAHRSRAWISTIEIFDAVGVCERKLLSPHATDKWYINDLLTVNNRFSFIYRELERNATATDRHLCLHESRNAKGSRHRPPHRDQVVGRQLREQFDMAFFDYQFEPVWNFNTGPVGHTLFTGLEAIRQTTYTQRQTANLANIADVFAPVPPEPNGILFYCDANIPATTIGSQRPI